MSKISDNVPRVLENTVHNTNKPRTGAKTIKMCLKQISTVNNTEPISN